MNRNEFVESLAIGGVLVNVGNDDSGQCYFLEWVESNQLVCESCGTYNLDYRDYAETKFGFPSMDCEYYRLAQTTPDTNCSKKNTYGYCYKCPYNDIDETHFNELVSAGIVDRRGNVNSRYCKYLTKNAEGMEELTK